MFGRAPVLLGHCYYLGSSLLLCSVRPVILNLLRNLLENFRDMIVPLLGTTTSSSSSRKEVWLPEASVSDLNSWRRAEMLCSLV